MSKRSDNPVELSDVLIPYTLGDLSIHVDYEEAKAGDTQAAIRLALDLVTEELALKVSAVMHTGDMFLPVLAQENQGRNKIPLAIAKVLQKRTGYLVNTDVYQVNKVGRTDLNGLSRIFAVPEFDGELSVRELSFFLIDDTLTQGGTFASLASHLRQNGALAVGAMALTGKQYSARLKLSDEVLNKLQHKYSDIENDFRETTGYGFTALTQSEGRYLANYKPSKSIRDRILAERNERIRKRDG